MIPRWLAAAALSCLFALSTFTLADPDLWGHVRFGIDTIQTRTLPEVDPYSFTQDRPWINHEWLSEMKMGAAYLLAGGAGLAILKGLLVCTAWLVVLATWREVSAGARIVAFVLFAAGTARLTLTMRPQLWSFLFFAVMCAVLARLDVRRARWLPLLFAVWANVHGGWVLGLGVTAVWLAAAVRSVKPNAMHAIVLLAFCAASTLATPYGVGLWRFIAETVRLGRDIGEWQPVWTTPPANWVVWIGACVVSGWAALESGRMRWPAIAVLGMLGYASMQVERLVPFFVIAAVVMVAPAARARWPAKPGAPTVARRDVPVLAGFAAAAGVAAIWITLQSVTCIRVAGNWVPDGVAVDMLRQAPPGRLVTFFDWGQYAIWHLGPRIQVSYDGRRETVYSPRRRIEHDAILFGTPEGERLVSSWNPAYVWLPAARGAARPVLERSGYRVTETAPGAFLAVRRDIPPLPMPAPAATSRRCFPD